MAEENGNKKAFTEVVDNKNNNYNTPSNPPMTTGKKGIDDITIEDILQNYDYFNDLLTNSRSPYLKLITTNNIKKLLSYCLYPKMYMNNNNLINIKRYPYYSSQILCSQLVLLFSKSTKNIIRANQFLADKENNNKNNNENESNENKSHIRSKSSDFGRNSQEFFDNALDINQNEDIFADINRENNFADFYQFKADFGDVEKYAEISETEFYKEPLNKKPLTEYETDEKKIINDTINEIFSLADFNNKEDQTYMGYFQKIINYLLFYESNIILNYLSKNRESSLTKFYKHLDSAAIQNILENILNILFDNEGKKSGKEGSKYEVIINDLIKELENEENLGKAEFICDLIISTLINNSDKQLIDLVLNQNNQNNIINKIKEIIDKIINKKNNEKNENFENNENNNKAIIALIQLLCQINNIIINTFIESSYFNKNLKNFDLSINIYKKVNAFEYQYLTKKRISNKNIFIAYEKNIYLYLKKLYEIFHIIKEEIKNKYKNYNENTKNNSINNNNINNNFGLRHLYEWQFIASILKIYIYSFYAVEKFNDDKNNLYYFAGYLDNELRSFLDEELIKIMFKYHFAYPQNNLYQNIFTDIIRLVCNEKCPESIIASFLKDKNIIRNKYIFKIIKNLKEEFHRKNNKYKLLLGTNVEILKIFYSSKNPYILQNLDSEQFKIDKKIKENFNNSITPKIERELSKDDYEYSDSEIFNDTNYNNITFDGNDEKRKYESFHLLIEKFVNKCKIKNIKNYNNEKFEKLETKETKGTTDKNGIINIKENYKNKEYEIENYKYNIKEKRIYIEYDKNKDFNMTMEIEMELEEKIVDEEIESNSDSDE